MMWFAIAIAIAIAIALFFIIRASREDSDSVLTESRSILVDNGVSEELLSSFDEEIKINNLPFSNKKMNIKYLTVYYLILHEAICLAEPHLQELFRQRRTGVTVETYGVINTQAWDNEYEYFYGNMMDSYLRGYLLDLSKEISVPFVIENENQIGPNDNSYDFYHEDVFFQLKKHIEISYLDVDDEVWLQDPDFIDDGFEYERELANS